MLHVFFILYERSVRFYWISGAFPRRLSWVLLDCLIVLHKGSWSSLTRHSWAQTSRLVLHHCMSVNGTGFVNPSLLTCCTVGLLFYEEWSNVMIANGLVPTRHKYIDSELKLRWMLFISVDTLVGCRRFLSAKITAANDYTKHVRCMLKRHELTVTQMNHMNYMRGKYEIDTQFS